MPRRKRSDAATPPDICPKCGGKKLRKHGRTPDNLQRWRCMSCLKTFVPGRKQSAAKTNSATAKPSKKSDKAAKEKQPQQSLLFVRCPSCKGIYHRTTDRFRPDVMATGDMFYLMEPWRTRYQWSSFPENSSIRGALIECPNCNTPYVGASGRVLIVVDPSDLSDDSLRS